MGMIGYPRFVPMDSAIVCIEVMYDDWQKISKLECWDEVVNHIEEAQRNAKVKKGIENENTK